jgi:hypothetical protein
MAKTIHPSLYPFLIRRSVLSLSLHFFFWNTLGFFHSFFRQRRKQTNKQFQSIFVPPSSLSVGFTNYVHVLLSRDYDTRKNDGFRHSKIENWKLFTKNWYFLSNKIGSTYITLLNFLRKFWQNSLLDVSLSADEIPLSLPPFLSTNDIGLSLSLIEPLTGITRQHSYGLRPCCWRLEKTDGLQWRSSVSNFATTVKPVYNDHPCGRCWQVVIVIRSIM